jgi:hypothetical protein
LATSGGAGCGVPGSTTASDSGAGGGGAAGGGAAVGGVAADGTATGGAAAGGAAAAVLSELRAKEERRWKSAQGGWLCSCVAPTWFVFGLSQGEGWDQRLEGWDRGWGQD